MLRRRTRKLAGEYVRWFGPPRVGSDTDSERGDGAEGSDRERYWLWYGMRQLYDEATRQATLRPTVAAERLREAASVVDEHARRTAEAIARIEAEYGDVFRSRRYLSGRYLAPYENLLSARTSLARDRRLAPALRGLARAYDRLARLRGLLPTWVGLPDIAALQDAGNTGALLRALDHHRDDIRQLAAGALGELRATEAVEPLLAILHNTRPRAEPPSDLLILAVTGALGRIGDPRAVEPLLRYAREHAESTTDTYALAALVEMREPRVYDVLVERLQENWRRRSAVRQLGELGDPRAVEPLRAVLADLEAEQPDSDVRRQLRDHELDLVRAAVTALERGERFEPPEPPDLR